MRKQKIVNQRTMLHLKTDKSEERGHIERFDIILF